MAENSVIGQSSQIRGNVRGRGAIEILGRVQGDVTMDGDVSLEDGGAVKGSITGSALRIAGSVQGDVTATNALALEATARVVGNLSAPRIGIAEGALVRGKIQTGDEVAPAPTRPTTGARSEPARVQVRPAAAPVASPKAEAPAPPRRVAPSPAPAPAHRPPPARAPLSPGRKPVAAPAAAAASTTGAKLAGRRPPPPVVPVLAKGIRGKKKTRER